MIERLESRLVETEKKGNEYYNDAANYQFGVSSLLDLTGHRGSSEDMIGDTAKGIRRLLKEREELRAENERLKKAARVSFNAFDERYDGAPDSGMTWMIEPMLALQKAL